MPGLKKKYASMFIEMDLRKPLRKSKSQTFL